MSYYSRKRNRLLKKIAILFLIFIYPLNGLIAALFLKISLMTSLSNLSAHLSLNKFSYFHSEWSLDFSNNIHQTMFKDIIGADKKINLYLSHGPFLKNQELPWYRLISVGKFLSKEEDLPHQLSFEMKFNGDIDFNYRWKDLLSYNGFTSFYYSKNLLTGNKTYSLNGKLIDDDPLREEPTASGINAMFKSTITKTLLQLPSSSFSVEKLYLPDAKINFKKIQGLLHVTKPGLHSSVIFDLNADSFANDDIEIKNLNTTQSLVNARAKPLNQIINNLVLKINDYFLMGKGTLSEFYNPEYWLTAWNYMEAGSYDLKGSGLMSYPLYFEFHASAYDEYRFEIKGHSNDLIAIVKSFDIPLSENIVKDIAIISKQITLHWTQNDGWSIAVPAT